MPFLVGRGAVQEPVRICIERLRRGKPAQSVVMVGPRGVGKTVLLDQIHKCADAGGVPTVRIEAAGNRCLPALLAPRLRLALLRLSRIEAAKHDAIKGLRALVLVIFIDKLQYRTAPSRQRMRAMPPRKPSQRWTNVSFESVSTG